MSFPRYPTYKDSGVKWLGEVPEHWGVDRLKYIAKASPSNVDKKSYEGDHAVLLCNYTDVYYNEEIVAGMSFMAATATTEQVEKFTLREGDTIITKDSETADDIAISAYVPQDLPGVVCGYHLSLIRPREGVVGRFIKRLFDSHFARATLGIAANGLTRYGLSQYPLDNFELPLPPAGEQTAIATFLDCETAKIDALVSDYRTLIELLQEKRQAVISHAVTKGLDSTVPMKDSRVEWLGEVPAHWETKHLKYLTAPGRDIMYGIVLPGPDVGVGVPIVKGGDVKPARLKRDSLNCTTPEIEAPFARARLKPDDIIYSIRGSIGDAELVPAELADCNITQDVARVSPADDVDPHWLLYVMKSRNVFVQLEQRSLGAAVRGINIFDLKRASVAVPPSAEQWRIATLLRENTSKINFLITDAQEAITLLQERRATLISAAVTGKIDVRGLVIETPPVAVPESNLAISHP